jgi:hypothetical protein
MKKTNWFPLVAVVAVLALGSVHAQDSRPLKVTIPFDFTAGNRTLPAGEYTVKSMNISGTLAVVGRGSALALVNSQAVQANRASETSKLVFHRYGSRYFLAQIWVEGAQRGRELPRTRVEQEIASNGSSASVAVLAQK